MRGLSKTVAAAFGRKPHSPFLKSGGLPTAATILIFAIRIYRLVVSPAQVFLFGPTGGCRFTPTCSQYAVEAIHSHGILTGSALAMKRICRCHPFGDCGHNPVPQGEFKIKNSKLKNAELVR